MAACLVALSGPALDSQRPPGVVAHAYNSRFGEAGMGVSLRLAGQPVLPLWPGTGKQMDVSVLKRERATDVHPSMPDPMFPC